MLCFAAQVSAGPTAVPLNDHTRLGQHFRAPRDVCAEMVAGLKAARSGAARAEAARRLVREGRPESIPMLAELLSDGNLAHAARSVLEAMPTPEAGAALRAQLPKLNGAPLVGAINSIGERGDAEAVAPLTALLRNSAPEVAAAAAAALGKIGTGEAADALTRAIPGLPNNGRTAAFAGALDCATRLAARGERERAFELLDCVRKGADIPLAIRKAATRGAILNAPANRSALLIDVLRSPDTVDLEVGLWIVGRELPGTEVARTIAEGLGSVPLDRHVRVIEALCSRGDKTALPVLLTAVKSERADLRTAALSGLAEFPAARVAEVLVDALGDPREGVADAAESVLAGLDGEEADAAVLRAIQGGNGAAVVRAIRVAGVRRFRAAFPVLLTIVDKGDSATAAVAAKVSRALAGPGDVPALLSCLSRCPEGGVRRDLGVALVAACGKAEDRDACAATLIASLQDAGPGLSTSLLRALREVGGRRALGAVVASTRDADRRVCAAAVRLLADWKNSDAVPEIARLAQHAADPSDRLVCLRGYISFAGRDALPVGRRLEICRRAAKLVQRTADKVQLLGMVGQLAVLQALDLAVPFLDDAAVRREAAVAVLSVAEQLVEAPHAERVAASLRKVVQKSDDADSRGRATALLGKIRGQLPK